MENQTLLTYILTCIIAAGTPGPGTISVIVYSAMVGWRKTLPVIFGVQAGMFAMAVLALSGVSAALTASPKLFIALQYLGAGYIAYLGVMSLLASRQAEQFEATMRDKGNWQNFNHGMIVTFASPKTLLFFTSFFPLFMESDKAVFPQISWLLFILLFCTLMVHLVYCFFMQKMTDILKKYNQQFNFSVGVIFLFLALYMAWGI